MSPRKHILFVHGRSTKPSKRVKRKLIVQALLHGIERTSPEAAARIRARDVKFTLAYYGDVNNRILRLTEPKSRRWLTERDPDFENARCESESIYRAAIDALFARSTRAFTRTAYRKFLDEVDNRAYLDDVAGALSALGSLVGLNDVLIRHVAPDMSAYLLTRSVGSEIRVRLQDPLKRALRRGEQICLIAHSMGCIVAYDVLWKFSRMSEYRELHEQKVDTFLTLGNPLGEPGVKAHLYDAHEPPDGKFPTSIHRWVNMTAQDDFVAHDEKIANDFREMRRRGLARYIIDRPKIYNFYATERGANPHKAYAYLDNPKVGQEIARWILDTV